MAQAIVTIRKLGGVLNIADAPRPAHTENTLMMAEIAIASTGRGVSMIAVAAGVTIRANSSSVPTTCTAMVTATANSTVKTIDSARTGTPRASATGAFTELNSSGR